MQSFPTDVQQMAFPLLPTLIRVIPLFDEINDQKKPMRFIFINSKKNWFSEA